MNIVWPTLQVHPKTKAATTVSIALIQSH